MKSNKMDIQHLRKYGQILPMEILTSNLKQRRFSSSGCYVNNDGSWRLFLNGIIGSEHIRKLAVEKGGGFLLVLNNGTNVTHLSAEYDGTAWYEELLSLLYYPQRNQSIIRKVKK